MTLTTQYCTVPLTTVRYVSGTIDHWAGGAHFLHLCRKMSTTPFELTVVIAGCKEPLLFELQQHGPQRGPLNATMLMPGATSMLADVLDAEVPCSQCSTKCNQLHVDGRLETMFGRLVLTVYPICSAAACRDAIKLAMVQSVSPKPSTTPDTTAAAQQHRDASRARLRQRSRSKVQVSHK
jgi:hypothetical protein